MKRLITFGALVALTLNVSACGLRDKLDRPAPMWGAERARWEAAQQAGQAGTPTPTVEPQRPMVEIPVDNGTAPATEQTASSDREQSTKDRPLISQSKGALPPVQGATSAGNFSNY